MRRLAHSCCRGIAAEGLGEKMIEKYAYALHLVLTDCTQWATEAVLDELERDRQSCLDRFSDFGVYKLPSLGLSRR